MTATLTRLFVISTVANVRSLSSLNSSISLSEELLSGSSDSTSVGERLKKAIYDALAKPDKRRSKITNRIATTTLTSIGLTLI